MDKKDIIIVFLIIALVAVVFFIASSKLSLKQQNIVTQEFKTSSTQPQQNIIAEEFKGDTKEQNLRSYISDTQKQQTKTQREQTIKLYLNALGAGKANMAKIQRAEEAPEICNLAQNVVKGASNAEKAKSVLDYLYGAIVYDWGNVIIDATGKPRIRAEKYPTEVLAEKKGLCGEVSNTVLLFADCLSLPIYFIQGGGHAWNVFVEGSTIIELDATQGCFDCDMIGFGYPAVGICSLDKCIDISQITDITAQSIFKQALARRS